MVIQERDRDIIALCYEQKFLVIDQVRETFFRHASRQEAYRRVSELERAGFVRRQRLAIWANAYAIQLTRQGMQLARERVEYPFEPARTFDLATLGHDILVTWVRLRLQELWDMVWIPEQFWKNRRDVEVIPDGVVMFKTNAKIAVEVENSQKKKGRIHYRLGRLAGGGTKEVLFVATKESVAEFLRKEISASHHGEKVAGYIVLWDELKKGTPEAWSRIGPCDIFSRRELE